LTSGARFERCILATTVLPWTETFNLDEGLFRDEVRYLIDHGCRNLYAFGTAGEGYAVDDAQFEQVARVFADELRTGGAEPMLGVISLSLATIMRRIAFARDSLGVRLFQISLPSWGALEEAEVRTFFEHVLGNFEDCQFLHYNLLRAKRLLTGRDYAAIAADHPNLVATKNSTDSMQRIRELTECAPMLRHFLNERGFVYGSLLGECGLLMSVASVNLDMARRYFDAGCARDMQSLVRMEGELDALSSELVRLVSGGVTRIDGAFDKVLWWLHDRRFPLRLLPPYDGATHTSAEAFAAFVSQRYPEWA
jgi:dihydrodipicolinate synthase/N-acetylneuraminate lyase